MAQIDLLTNGTITVDLASNLTNAFAQISGTYKQQIIELDQLGRYPLVWEEWSLNWSAIDDEQRGEIPQQLLVLKRLAKQWSDRLWRDPPVWRVLQTPAEGAPRYAFVFDLQIPELSPEFYEPSQQTKRVLIRVLREGTFRLSDPAVSVLSGGDGSTWISMAGQTVFDYQAGANTNYLTLAPTAAGEDVDAEMLLRLDLDYGAFDAVQDSNIIISRKSGTLAELAPFNSQFNAVDATIFADPPVFPLPVVDANIAGGTRVDMQNNSGSEKNYYLQWILPDLVAYTGSYLVYAQVNMINNSDLIMEFLQGFGIGLIDSSYTGLDPVNISDLTPALSWRWVFLGLATVPVYGAIPRGVTPAADYRIRLKITVPNTGSIQFGRLFMAPVDEGIFSVRNIDAGGGTSGLLVNGDLLRSYPINGSGEITSLPVNPNGRYLTAAFERYTRYYFFKSGQPDLGYDASYYGLSDTEIQPRVIGRVKALRIAP